MPFLIPPPSPLNGGVIFDPPFWGSFLTPFLTPIFDPPTNGVIFDPPIWGSDLPPLPIYIIYVSFRTYFAQKICGDLMGTFSSVFRGFWTPFFDPFQIPLLGYPPFGGPIGPPFLYILFTLVLGHILHKKYVGI